MSGDIAAMMNLEAINKALADAMEADPKVLLLGCRRS